MRAGGWLLRRLACGACGALAKAESKDLEEALTEVSTPVASEPIDSVVLVDQEGFEWAIDDGPPARPASIPKGHPFIPFQVRPQRGSLRNQVLTYTEVPDPISPDPAERGQFVTLEIEQLRRRLRAAAADVGRFSGSHVRQGSRLVRNDMSCGVSDITVESVPTTASLDWAASKQRAAVRKRPPRSTGMDAALRARIAVYRR